MSQTPLPEFCQQKKLAEIRFATSSNSLATPVWGSLGMRISKVSLWGRIRKVGMRFADASADLRRPVLGGGLAGAVEMASRPRCLPCPMRVAWNLRGFRTRMGGASVVRHLRHLRRFPINRFTRVRACAL